MSQNKEIKFTTSTDTRGLDQITEKLKKLRQVADEVSSRFKQIKLGGGSNSRPDELTQVVKGTTAEMGKLRLESIKTAETMSDRLGRAVLINTQQIRQQTREFQSAAKAARDFHGATPASASRMGVMMGGGGGMGAGVASMMGMAASPMGYGAAGGGGRRGGTGGNIPPGATGYFGHYSASNPRNYMFANPGWGQMANTAQATFGAIGDMGAMAGKFGQFESSTAMMGLNNLARAQSFRQDIYRLSTSAPVGYGAFIQGKGTAYSDGNNNSREAIADGARGLGPGRVARNKVGTNAAIQDDISGQVVQGAAISAGASLVTNGAAIGANGVQTVKNLVTGDWGNAANSSKAAVDAGFDIAKISKSTGSGELSAVKAEAQSAVLGLQQRIAGPQAQQMFANIQGYSPLLATASRMNGGMGRQAMAMGAGSGYDVGSSAALMGGLGTHFGSRAVMEGGLGRDAFNMSRKGMEGGVAGGIMGQIQMGGGDGAGVLERIFAKGVASGMGSLDMHYFEKIGAAVAENSITQSGSVSGGNLPEALMFGLNKKSTMADVQGNIAGMNLANQMSTSNPYFASRRTAMAADILGDDASGVTIQALAETSLTDLMADDNEYLDALNIKKEKRQEHGKQFIEAFGRTLASGSGKGKESERIKAGIEKYGSFQKYMEKSGKKERKFVGAVGKSVFSGAEYKDFAGAMNFFGGTDQKAGSGKPGSGGLKDVVDGQAIVNIATQTKIIFKQFENLNNTLKETHQTYSALAKETVDNMQKTMKVGGENYEGSENAAMGASAAAGGLSRVATVADETADALARLHGVALAAKANKAAQAPKPEATEPQTTKPRTNPMSRLNTR